MSPDDAPPTTPGVDPDTIDAVADDLEDLIAVLEGAAHNLVNIRSGLLRAAAEAKATK
jgi:hypothetical protein